MFVEKFARQRGRAGCHQGDAFAAIAGGNQVTQFLSTGTSHLLACDVRREKRLTQNTGIKNKRPQTQGFDLMAKEREFFTFRVQRAQDCDRLCVFSHWAEMEIARLFHAGTASAAYYLGSSPAGISLTPGSVRRSASG